jgi:hypothetical protein
MALQPLTEFRPSLGSEALLGRRISRPIMLNRDQGPPRADRTSGLDDLASYPVLEHGLVVGRGCRVSHWANARPEAQLYSDATRRPANQVKPTELCFSLASNGGIRQSAALDREEAVACTGVFHNGD